jgi:hypothetical protein
MKHLREKDSPSLWEGAGGWVVSPKPMAGLRMYVAANGSALAYFLREGENFFSDNPYKHNVLPPSTGTLMPLM